MQILPEYRNTVFPHFLRHTYADLFCRQIPANQNRLVECRQFIGQRRSAEQAFSGVTEGKRQGVQRAAVIDDKMIIPVEFVRQVEVRPVDGVMLLFRLIDIQNQVQMAVGVHFDVAHIRTARGQPARKQD